MSGKDLYFDSRNRRKVGGGGQRTFLPSGVVGRKELENLYLASVARDEKDIVGGVYIDSVTSWKMGAIAYLQAEGPLDWEELKKRGCTDDTIKYLREQLAAMIEDGKKIRRLRGL